MPAALLGGAALAGVAAGLGEALLSGGPAAAADPAIEWNSVQAVPARELAADDLAWEQRGMDTVEVASTAAAATVRQPSATFAGFGFCHTGGGTNCVVDGDTIRLAGEKIRVADIDAPETHDPRCAAEQQLGNQATRRLQQLLNGGSVSLQATDRDEDRYGRKLRIVLVDGRSVGEMLVGEGLARSYGNGRRPWC
jgi:endonuclease YncB( thermonuclease family)